MPLRRLYSRCQRSDRHEGGGHKNGGGDGRARTGDPLLAKQVLSQLSYAPRGKPGGRRRGPFWIRTRDLTVISRALSPAELKARVPAARGGARAQGAARPAARVSARALSVRRSP